MYRLLDDHKTLKCTRRPATCPYNCGVASMPADELTVHLQSRCRYRPIICALGCGVEIPAKKVQNHEQACEYRYVPCRLNCGQQIRLKDLNIHEKVECLRRR